MQQGGNREFLSVGNVWTTAGGYPIEKWVDSELLRFFTQIDIAR
jgi:hypothetical protein